MTTRRRVLAGVVGVGVAPGPLLCGSGAAQAALAPTPADAEGPFFPTTLPSDTDADLTQSGTSRPAEGQRLIVTGRVLTTAGQPLVGAVLELWQTDARGNYLHPQGAITGQRDPGFQGYGRTVSDSAGAYQFRTVMPVAYRGRPPHLHLKITAGSRRLITQLYLGIPRTGGRRDGLILDTTQGPEPDTRLGRFEFVLAG
ncbi:MAG: intradiol ring-cleavage dioxygenase [Alphaproteobacteria bacterium]|nr:intradiol ring-cleavage dioxygenase [Alphaproteobacteria bacterium]TAD88319.1 MAG: intradiol ring-cleavage dioxygenase [Alphaproteobacteria bacterium]